MITNKNNNVNNSTNIMEQINIDFRNFKVINKGYIDSLALLSKTIDMRLLDIHNTLQNIALKHQLTYKIGIYFGKPKRFIIWYSFDSMKKRWNYSLRNFRSIMTTVRTNVMFRETSQIIMTELRAAHRLIKLQQTTNITNIMDRIIKALKGITANDN